MSNSTETEWIIGYDIAQTRLRQKACRTLRAYSPGYQKSVFEVLAGKRDVEALAIWLSQAMEPASDRLFIAARSRATASSYLGDGAVSPGHTGFLIFI